MAHPSARRKRVPYIAVFLVVVLINTLLTHNVSGVVSHKMFVPSSGQRLIGEGLEVGHPL